MKTFAKPFEECTTTELERARLLLAAMLCADPKLEPVFMLKVATEQYDVDAMAFAYVLEAHDLVVIQ